VCGIPGMPINRVATSAGSVTPIIRIWNLETGSCDLVLKGHEDVRSPFSAAVLLLGPLLPLINWYVLFSCRPSRQCARYLMEIDLHRDRATRHCAFGISVQGSVSVF
jgi:hypothetical protein